MCEGCEGVEGCVSSIGCGGECERWSVSIGCGGECEWRGV